MTPSRPTTPGSDPERQVVRMLSLALVVAGVITIALAIWLGSEVDSFLYALALVSLGDFVLAWAFGSGRIGPLAARRREAEASGDPFQS